MRTIGAFDGVTRRANFALRRSYVKFLVLTWLVVSCSKRSDPPPAQAGYPPQGPGTTPVAQAPGYTSGNPQPVLAASPTSGATSTGALSQPGPLALPCQSDLQCLTHHCNVTAGKCAWPCQTDNDCMPGNACIAPTCLPKLQ